MSAIKPISTADLSEEKTLTSRMSSTRFVAINLLQKISWIAVYLLLMRVLSASGVVIALWLCPVQIFANVGIYLASISFVALAIFGRFEFLVVSAPDEQHCVDAVYLCLITAAAIVGCTLIVALEISHQFDSNLALVFSASLFSRAWLRLGLILATRYGSYDRAVKALLPHTIAQPIVLVWLLYKGYSPLVAFVASDFIGHFVAATCVCLSERQAFRAVFLGDIRWHRIKALAACNVGLPTLNLTTAASAFLFATAPLFFLPALSNGVVAGTLALLFRLLDIPTFLTNSSISPILMKEVADCNRSHGTRKLSPITFLLPAVAATTIFGSISLGGLTVSDLQLAPAWHMALTLLPVVALFQASIAATNPLIDIATLAGRQKGLLTLNVASVAFAVGALFYWAHDPIFAIVIAGSIGFVRVAIMSAWLMGHAWRLPTPNASMTQDLNSSPIGPREGYFSIRRETTPLRLGNFPVLVFRNSDSWERTKRRLPMARMSYLDNFGIERLNGREVAKKAG